MALKDLETKEKLGLFLVFLMLVSIAVITVPAVLGLVGLGIIPILLGLGVYLLAKD